jgi:hypothetical protein
MKNVSQAIVVSTAVLVAASSALGNEPTGTMAITLSMEQPSAHYYHVVFRCEGLVGETQDFKMPAWTPGYYQIMDFARNVRGFRAEDEAGNPLPWQKTTKNTWRVKSGQATSVTVSYDVYAFGRSVADSYLDDTRGYISPAAVFMHVAGQIRHPVTISVRPHPTWSRISTGLEPLGDGRAPSSPRTSMSCTTARSSSAARRSCRSRFEASPTSSCSMSWRASTAHSSRST